MSDKVQLYSKVRWKDIVEVYQCSSCSFSDEDEDTMKLHVVGHFPPEQGNKVLDMLVDLQSEEKGQG